MLFGGAAVLQEELLRAIDGLPPALSPLEVVQIAVEAVSRMMVGRRDSARARSRIVAAHADLQERNLIKRAALTTTLADAVRQRGIPEPAASLAADMGITVFYVGFNRWLDDAAERELPEIVREGFDQIKAFASGT